MPPVLVMITSEWAELKKGRLQETRSRAVSNIMSFIDSMSVGLIAYWESCFPTFSFAGFQFYIFDSLS